MTGSVVLGLAVQLLAALVMHRTVRGRWVSNVGALLLAVAILYHGVTEVMQWLWPGRDRFRTLTTQGQINDFVVLVSAVMLTYSIGYALMRRPARDPDPSAAAATRGLSPWWLLVATGPLLVLTATGHGFVAPQAVGTTSPTAGQNYVSGGLAIQFLVYLAGVAAVVAVVRWGPRRGMVLLLGEAVLMGLAGVRSLSIIAALLAAYGLAVCGVRFRRRAVVGLILVLAVLGSVISAGRAAEGRAAFQADQGTTQRVSTLTDGVAALGTTAGREAVLQDTVYRFDGNAFGALVLSQMRAGVPPVGLTTTANNVALAVPSFLNPGKLQTSVASRDEETYLDEHYGLPVTDYLPGIFPVLMTYFGLAGWFILAALLGLALAAADQFVHRRSTPARLLFGIGLANCVLLYERGPSVFPLAMRGFLLLVAAMAFADWLNRKAPTGSHLGADLRPRAGRAGGSADVQHPGDHAHLAHHSGVGGGRGQ